MRRSQRHTDRFGTPLRPLFADELRPVNAPKTRPGQCWHGMNESWIARCEADGTYRIASKISDSYYPRGSRSWVEAARYCKEHKPPFAVPIEELET